MDSIIYDPLFEHACRDLCSMADWSRPALAHIASLHHAGKHREAALALVHHLRARRTPVFVYTPEYVRALRTAASTEQRQAARARIADMAIGEEPQAIAGRMRVLGTPDLHLGATPELGLRIASAALSQRGRWGEWAWWGAHSFCHGISALWPLEEIADEHLIPLLAWMLTAISTEWAGSRDWHEVMFGANGHNYFVTAYGGFAMAGLLFPEFIPTLPLRALIPDWLEYEIERLMQPDGFTRERAGYHWGTADELISLAHLAELNAIALSSRTTAHLKEIAAAGTWKTLSPDGAVPCNGDTGARHSPGDGTSLRVAAARFSLPEAKYVAEALSPDWKPPFKEFLPDRGQNLWPAYQQLRPRAPAGPDTCLEQSGYYVMRQNWTPRADYCFIDAGARGNTVTSHDHAAVFNIELHSRGRAALLDNCSGRYGGSPGRLWRIGSSAHNVATVDEEPQVPIVNEWRWGMPVCPTIERWQSGERFAYFSGAHEGYCRLRPPVVCRRKLFYLRGQYWILVDRFTTESKDDEHLYEVHFHPRQGARLLEDGRCLTTGPGGNVLVAQVPGAAGEHRLEPNPFPLEGYDNPDHLSYSRRGKGNWVFVTVLASFEADRVPALEARLAAVTADGRSLSPWEATGLELTLDGRRDVYLDLHMSWNSPWRVGDFTGAQRLFHSECR